MATETGRVIKRKRIKLPNGNTVDIPVIVQISFLDPADRGWETTYTFDNTGDADRTVHVASIPGGGAPTDETGSAGASNLRVERIDKFKVLDGAERGQETFPEPDSKTIQQPPDAPPYFTTHAKTHIVKYLKRNDDDTEDSSAWIKSELIDQISFTDSSDRGQETQFTLSNPPDNQDIDGLRFGTDDDDKPTISVNPDVEEITDYNGDPDPVRTDPFQNIVDFEGEPVVIGWLYEPHYTGTTQPPALAAGQTALTFTPTAESGTAPGTNFAVGGPVPSVTPLTLNFSDDPKTWVWTYKSGTIFLLNEGTTSATLSIPFKGLSDFTDPSSLVNEGSISCSWSAPTLEKNGIPWTLYIVRISIATLDPTPPPAFPNVYGPNGTGGPFGSGILFEAWFKP